jgi:DNA repair exonuclease SbcCD ATPase subunit
MENHDSSDLDELRQRLDRRNHLLEVIRKAYHRDIIVVREYLLQLQNGTKIEDIKAEDLDLRTIPSIDLRNDGFHLFSPQECELVIKPCYNCGGRLEVTHRESQRFMDLMKCCEELKRREIDLNSKLDDSCQRIKIQQETIVENNCQALKEQNSLLLEIEQLQKCLSDRNELEQLCKAQKEQINQLENIRHEKELIEETLTKMKLELSNLSMIHAALEENNEALTRDKEDGLHRETELKIRLDEMINTKEELQQTISLLEELEIQRKEELKVWKDQMRG